MSTPKKISARNPVCMLCGNSHESLRVIRIFSKSGTSKDLCVKVHKFCGITISEEDSSAKVICRVCVAFVNKMEQFIQKALSIQNMLYEENSEYSIKRCVQLSPSLHKPWKRLSCMPSESCVNIPSTSADQPSIRASYTEKICEAIVIFHFPSTDSFNAKITRMCHQRANFSSTSSNSNNA